MKQLRSRLRVVDTATARPPAKRVEPFYQSAAWVGFIADIIAFRGRRCEDPACDGSDGPWSRIFGDHTPSYRMAARRSTRPSGRRGMGSVP